MELEILTCIGQHPNREFTARSCDLGGIRPALLGVFRDEYWVLDCHIPSVIVIHFHAFC